MPLKTQKVAKKHPHHYAKVYWPYIPLVVFVAIGLWVGKPFVERSQRGVLAYTSNISGSDLLIDTNQVRLGQGDQAIKLNDKLNQAAQAKANDMVTRDYWSHVTPDGKTPWQFIGQTGYQYQKAGENLAYGFVSTNDIISGWMNSPAHRENLLDPSYQEVGFGVANSQDFQGNGPETIVVALYGKPGTPQVLGASSSGASDDQAFSTSNPFGREANMSVSKVQTITAGETPWVTLMVGVVGGLALSYVFIKNGVGIHRKIRKGERFVIKHPVFDITVVVFVAVCALLCQSVGLIR
jgi:hypothetical protein